MLPKELEQARASLRAELGAADGAARTFAGRISVVLSGGGAFGAYEAGALLAFQDADVPTPIIAATSIGSINAASYAAHSDTTVGNAEPLVEAWMRLTSAAVGIQWIGYGWMLAGFVAVVAGLVNLAGLALQRAGMTLHLHHALWVWVTLTLCGVAALLLFEHLPYLLHAVAATARRRIWKFDRRRLALSAAANILVLVFLIVLLDPLHLHTRLPGMLSGRPYAAIAVTAAIVGSLIVLYRVSAAAIGRMVHRLLRVFLRQGLFDNFERERLLSAHIHADRLRGSPIRLLVTTTDLEHGAARYFSNVPCDIVAADPRADRRFVESRVCQADDLIAAIMASSAVPIVYAPVAIDGRPHADGAIAGNQPLRPAVGLGADVIFVVNLDPFAARRTVGNTFVDVGLQALALMMSWSLVADMEALEQINSWCARAAARCGLAPEQVLLHLGDRRFRYIKLFPIQPESPLQGTVLDFGGRGTADALVRGYRDAAAQIIAFGAYAGEVPFAEPRRTIEVLEQVELSTAAGASTARQR